MKQKKKDLVRRIDLFKNMVNLPALRKNVKKTSKNKKIPEPQREDLKILNQFLKNIQ